MYRTVIRKQAEQFLIDFFSVSLSLPVQFPFILFSELWLLWDVSDYVYYYGMLTGVGGVAVSMATVAKGTVEWGREGLSLVVGGGVIMVCMLQGNYAVGGRVNVCMYVYV